MMQELKHCKIAQGLEIANEQQWSAVGATKGGVRDLKPYLLFQWQIICGPILCTRNICVITLKRVKHEMCFYREKSR